jgi:hypothetical protein
VNIPSFTVRLHANILLSYIKSPCSTEETPEVSVLNYQFSTRGHTFLVKAKIVSVLQTGVWNPIKSTSALRKVLQVFRLCGMAELFYG